MPRNWMQNYVLCNFQLILVPLKVSKQIGQVFPPYNLCTLLHWGRAGGKAMLATHGPPQISYRRASKGFMCLRTSF